MSDRDPRLLPGVSAYIADQRATYAVVISVLGFLLVFIAVCVTGGLLSESDLNLWAVLTVALGSPAVVALVGLIVSLRLLSTAKKARRAELAAGYTTLLTQFDQVDGIDWKTGAVSRPAKPRVSAASIPQPFTSGIELGAIDAGPTGLQVVLRKRWAQVGFLFSLASSIILFSLLFSKFVDDDAMATLLTWAGSLAVVATIVFPAYAIALGPERYYRKFLLQRFTPDHVFGTQSCSEFGDMVDELLGAAAPALPDARPRMTCYLVFERLVLYSRHRAELVPFLVIPRSRIASTRMDVNSQSRGPDIPVVVLALRKDDATQIELTLQFLPAASWTPSRVVTELRSDNDWVAGWASTKSLQPGGLKPRVGDHSVA